MHNLSRTPPQIILGANVVVCGECNAERERNFAEEGSGEESAKFASRALLVFGGAGSNKKHN
jgi:hypothetical protein